MISSTEQRSQKYYPTALSDLCYLLSTLPTLSCFLKVLNVSTEKLDIRKLSATQTQLCNLSIDPRAQYGGAEIKVFLAGNSGLTNIRFLKPAADQTGFTCCEQVCRSNFCPNTHTLLTQRSWSGLTIPVCGHSVEDNLSGYELTRNLPGNIRPQSSQLVETL